MRFPRYLDAAATTPVNPIVLDAMLPFFTEIYGNANSDHIFGQTAKKAMDDARESIAEFVNVLPEEIVFTSGATEAITLAIRGFWEANRHNGNHIVTVKTEHKAVLNTCLYLETLGVEVTYLEVNHFGQITADQLRGSIRPDTILACIMHVNNETGLVQDILSFAEICAEKNVAFFTDSTQSIGQIDLDCGNSSISMACMSAHKIQGPKGVGALVVKRNIQIQPLCIGGGQSSLEYGTANTPGIVGLSTAITLSRRERKNFVVPQEADFSFFSRFGAKRVIPKELSAPHIMALSLPERKDSDELIAKATQEFSFSRGSACNSGLLQKSHVFNCLGEGSENRAFLRLSYY